MNPGNPITMEYGGEWRRHTVSCLTCAKYKLKPGVPPEILDDIPGHNRCKCDTHATCPTCGGSGEVLKVPPSGVLFLPSIQSLDDTPPGSDTDPDVFCAPCSMEHHHDVYHSPPVCPER